MDTFLGAILHLSNESYKKSDKRFDGSIDISEDDNKKSMLLNLDGDPDELDKKDEVIFKVNSPKKTEK